jgi:uncharacterized protein (TIGR04255 family)
MRTEHRLTAMTMSSSKRHYPKAPITEALIDLGVELPANFSAEDLAKVQKGEEAAYPTVERIDETVGQVLVGPALSAASTTRQHRGFLFRSSDGKHIQQARTNGFTMSRLAPYPRWEEFRSEARRLWDIYRAIAHPTKVVRVAVRYINRIDIPLPLSDFGEYLRTVPQVSTHLPQGLNSYFMQLVIPLDDIKSQAIINETIIDPARANVVSVVLDIDIFRSDDLPSSEEGIWGFIEHLRDVKDNVFEACITDKARELFQ